MKYITCILLLFTIYTGRSQETNRIINKGNEAYRLQQYDKAAAAYKEALEKEPGNVIASFNMGNALFKEKKFEEAAKIFDEAAKKTEDKKLKSQLFYNKGVALTQQKKVEESISSYKQSLRINASDSLARENLQRALNEKKQQEQQQQQQKQQKEQKENQPKPKQNKLNQQQVQQLLKALEEQEKKLQDKANRKTPVANQPDKDW